MLGTLPGRENFRSRKPKKWKTSSARDENRCRNRSTKGLTYNLSALKLFSLHREINHINQSAIYDNPLTEIGSRSQPFINRHLGQDCGILCPGRRLDTCYQIECNKMTPERPENSSILILGAGCFGLAAAHQLALSGYKNVTVLDKSESIPSHFSAAYDINKVIRAEYADPFYTDLSLVGVETIV